MIPKKIHYCWFGHNQLPELAIKCIESWKKFFPDYEIIEWNENNFDVNIIPYTKEAYNAKKYAFVSDYARFWILYNEGGLYFDTDVEVISSFEDIVERGPFMGVEVPVSNSNKIPLVAPGLGLGVTPCLGLYREILDYYKQLHFLDINGKPNEVTVVKHTTNILASHGMKNINEIQNICGVWIYPKDYFNPFNDNTAELNMTENTRSIHWYSKSWERKRNPIISWVVRRIHRYFGVNSLQWLNDILRRK